MSEVFAVLGLIFAGSLLAALVASDVRRHQSRRQTAIEKYTLIQREQSKREDQR